MYKLLSSTWYKIGMYARTMKYLEHFGALPTSELHTDADALHNHFLHIAVVLLDHATYLDIP